LSPLQRFDRLLWKHHKDFALPGKIDVHHPHSQMDLSIPILVPTGYYMGKAYFQNTVSYGLANVIQMLQNQHNPDHLLARYYSPSLAVPHLSRCVLQMSKLLDKWHCEETYLPASRQLYLAMNKA